MHRIDLTTGGHVWEKQNLVTIGATRTRGAHDVQKCKGCGITGRTFSLQYITIAGNISAERVAQCTGAVVKPGPKTVIITKMAVTGNKAFDNLKPGTKHDVIPAPPGQTEDGRGVWVMGVGEPVKILNSEFE